MSDLLDRLELLDWLPGETLFSLVSRLHRFWGYSLAGGKKNSDSSRF